MATYSELLLDPRWQKKRLLIMQRDQFRCQNCNNESKTLNVHHLCYNTGMRPWDYADHLLITLCQPCHKKEEDLKKQEFAEGKFLLRLWTDEILGEIMLQVWESKSKYEAVERIKAALKSINHGEGTTVL